jgi:hypothetical protein
MVSAEQPHATLLPSAKKRKRSPGHGSLGRLALRKRTRSKTGTGMSGSPSPSRRVVKYTHLKDDAMESANAGAIMREKLRKRSSSSTAM